MPLIGNDPTTLDDDTPKGYNHENCDVRDNHPTRSEFASNVRPHSLAACVELRDTDDGARTSLAHRCIEFDQMWRYSPLACVILIIFIVKLDRNFACCRPAKMVRWRESTSDRLLPSA